MGDRLMKKFGFRQFVLVRDVFEPEQLFEIGLKAHAKSSRWQKFEIAACEPRRRLMARREANGRERVAQWQARNPAHFLAALCWYDTDRSEEHTSELQSLMRISYAVFCLKKKKNSQIYHLERQ